MDLTWPQIVSHMRRSTSKWWEYSSLQVSLRQHKNTNSCQPKGQLPPLIHWQRERRQTTNVFHTGHCIFPGASPVAQLLSATNRRRASLQEVKGSFPYPALPYVLSWSWYLKSFVKWPQGFACTCALGSVSED